MVQRSTCLTDREWEILELIARGLHVHEVADELVISPRTVSTHVQHIRLKLGASNVANAVYLAMVAQNT